MSAGLSNSLGAFNLAHSSSISRDVGEIRTSAKSRNRFSVLRGRRGADRLACCTTRQFTHYFWLTPPFAATHWGHTMSDTAASPGRDSDWLVGRPSGVQVWAALWIGSVGLLILGLQ